MPGEYLTEVFYPSRFYDFMSPSLLNYLAALHGFPPRPLAPGFTYCELACGGGVTINTLAAAYPQGRFHGLDLNPEHIDHARQLAEAGQLENINFINADLNQLDFSELPEFDFITLHGLFSWVGDSTRQAILALLREKLRDGGLVMISYNALPGCAPIRPIRDMILAYAETLDDPREKIEEGIRYLRFLMENQAGYFRDNPGLEDVVEQYLSRDRDYLMHEFLNANWQPFYFIEIARAMAEIGLQFTGTFPIRANYLETSVPAAFHSFMHTAPDRPTLEQHKAFVRNDRFRCDVYIKTREPFLPEDQRPALFRQVYFGTEYSRVEKAVGFADVGDFSLDFSGEPVNSVADLLSAEPCSLAELRSRTEFAEVPETELLYALNMLVLGGYFRPFVEPAAVCLVAGWGTRLRIVSAFNRRILENCHLTAGDEVIYLACKVTGDGLAMSALDGLLLLALAETDVERAPWWAWQRLEAADRELSITDLSGEEEAGLEDQDPVELLTRQLQRLIVSRLNKLYELGIVEPASHDD